MFVIIDNSEILTNVIDSICLTEIIKEERDKLEKFEDKEIKTIVKIRIQQAINNQKRYFLPLLN